MQDFKGRETSLPKKEARHSGTLNNWRENICPSQQQSAQVNLFVIGFLVTPKMAQVWEEKTLEQEIRTV